MTIEFGRWRISPYQRYGSRCWMVKSDGVGYRYYDSLGDALRFTAEYDLRNECEGVGGIADALQAYQRLTERIENAASRLSSWGRSRADREND